jgi:uncharacterized membrane protein YbhN (UPF0104 family)
VSAGVVEPDSDDQPLWRKLFGPALMVAFLVFVFGWFLPRLIDYRAVLDTLLDLAAGEFLVLVALGTVRLAAEAWIYVALIPGLPLGKSLQAFLASTTVATFMPYPADLVVRFGMYRVWGIDATAAGVGIMTAGFWTIGVKLVLPVLGLIVLVVNGVASDDVVTLAFLAIGVLVAVFVVILAAVRSEGFVRWLGRAAAGLWAWLTGLFNRPVDEDFTAVTEEKFSEFRAQTVDVVRSGWVPATAATVASQAIWYVILVVSLRFMGVPADAVSLEAAFVAFCLAQLASFFPTPGGVGATEAVYVMVLTIPTEGAFADEIAAAAFLVRIFTWLLPIIYGAPALLLFNRKQKATAT